jgi:meiotically up-regulated gene 157 (Mug157) protein
MPSFGTTAVAAAVGALSASSFSSSIPFAAAAAPSRPMSRGAAKAVRASSTDGACTMPNMRPPTYQRTFVSPAVDAAIAALQPRFKDPNLGQLFANTLPNVLDSTVYRHVPPSGNSSGDSFLITGDIPASWLRDSTNQVLPYLPYLKNDTALRGLVAGVIARHASSILIDPYANAFQVDSTAGQGPHSDDSTTRPAYAGTTIDAMTPAIFERKWELDSLANPLRLAALYYNATGGDTTPYTPQWLASVNLILDTMEAQRLDTEEEDDNGGPPYVFQRTTSEPSDSLEHGRGPVARGTGLIKCGFRGSDDAVTLPFNIPENAFASVALRNVAGLLRSLNQPAVALRADTLAAEVENAIQAHGVYNHPTAGTVYAFEVDGFGNTYFMDDANIPSLLAMPYYGFTDVSDPLYQSTRAAVLSQANPYFMCGTTGCGIGGPHNGYYWIWPMAQVARAWTAADDGELMYVLDLLVNSSACTGLIHESYDRNGFGSYTRPWFAWANGLFASLVQKIIDEKPYLILN